MYIFKMSAIVFASIHVLVSGLRLIPPEANLWQSPETDIGHLLVPLRHNAEINFGHNQRLRESGHGTTCDFNESVWQEYIKFHQEGRQALARGKATPVLIWRCSEGDWCEGNGDSVRGIISTILLAIKTKRVFLLGPWDRSGFDVTKLFEKSHIDWRYDHATLTCDGTQYVGGLNIDATPDILSSTASCISLTTNVPPEMANIHDTPGCVWSLAFKMSEFYQQAISERMPLAPMSYAVVHVRGGDEWMTASGTDEKRIKDRKALERVLASVLHCASPIEAQHIIVLTDTTFIQNLAINASWISNEFPDGSIATPTNADGLPYIPTHTQPGRGSTKDGVLNAWLDFGIIARALAVVRTSGGFAFWASQIGFVPFKYDSNCNLEE